MCVCLGGGHYVIAVVVVVQDHFFGTMDAWLELGGTEGVRVEGEGGGGSEKLGIGICFCFNPILRLLSTFFLPGYLQKKRAEMVAEQSTTKGLAGKKSE